MIVVVSRVQCPMVCVGGNDRTPLLCSDDRLTPPLPHHHRPLAEVKLCISLQLRLQSVMSGGRELQCLDRTGERCENYLLEATCSPALSISLPPVVNPPSVHHRSLQTHKILCQVGGGASLGASPSEGEEKKLEINLFLSDLPSLPSLLLHRYHPLSPLSTDSFSTFQSM